MATKLTRDKPKLKIHNYSQKDNIKKYIFNNNIIKVQDYFREQMAMIDETAYINEVWQNDGIKCYWMVSISDHGLKKGDYIYISMEILPKCITFRIAGSTSGGKIDFLLNNDKWITLKPRLNATIYELSTENQIVNIYDEFDNFINKYLQKYGVITQI